MRDFLTMTKAASDETRARILMLLQGRELCLCQLIELLGLAPSTVSKHMALLIQADLVEFRKEGRWRYYRLPGKGAAPAVKQMLSWMRTVLRESPVVAEDARRLEQVLCMDRKILCERYKC